MRSHHRMIIVGKTFAGATFCIGALDNHGKGYRLKRPDFPFWDRHAGFEIGQEYEIECEPYQNHENPHHTEDVIVHHKHKTGRTFTKPEIVEILDKLAIVVFSEDPRTPFICTLTPHSLKRHPQRNYCYLDKDDVATIRNSVAFWRCPRELHAEETEFGVHYKNTDLHINIKYVGTEKFVEQLPAGMIIRLSTSGLWSPNEHRPSISYLQLSGWFA